MIRLGLPQTRIVKDPEKDTLDFFPTFYCGVLIFIVASRRVLLLPPPRLTHPTSPTQHHTLHITHPTSPTQHHTLNITHPTSHTQHHTPNITRPTSHTRHHTLNITHPTSHTQHYQHRSSHLKLGSFPFRTLTLFWDAPFQNHKSKEYLLI